jgi:hypothetical protein
VCRGVSCAVLEILAPGGARDLCFAGPLFESWPDTKCSVVVCVQC